MDGVKKLEEAVKQLEIEAAPGVVRVSKIMSRCMMEVAEVWPDMHHEIARVLDAASYQLGMCRSHKDIAKGKH